MSKASPTAIIGGLGVAAIGIAVFFVLRSEEDREPAVGTKSKSPASERASFRSARVSPDPSPAARPLEKEGRLYGPSGNTDWNRIASNLTPELAKQMLEKDRLEEKNIEVRAEKAWRIISQLCRNGFTGEAWALIEADPGMVREKAIHGFFRDAGLTESEILGKLDGLAKKERAMGMSGYWDRFAPEEFVRMDLAKFELRSPEERATLRQTFESMIEQAFDPSNPDLGKGTRKALLGFAVDQANAGVLIVSDLGKMMQKDPSKDGFAYWEALERIDPSLRKGQDSLKGTDAVVIRAMTVQDPERTLDMTLIQGTPARGKGYVALEKWLDQDFRKAEEWYHRNSDRADSDSSAVAFMRACATRGDYQLALDWYAKIQNESWKNGIGGEMRAIQRKLDAEAVE